MRAWGWWGALLGLLTLASAPEDKPMVLPQVIVDGQSKASDETASNTVVDRSQMEDAASDLPEVLDEQPGMRTSRLGGPGSFSSMAIRGSTGEQVNVYLDGVPLNSGVGGPVDLSSIPLGPVERVVIYRGLSPLSFGASAMGGVVSVRTRTPASTIFELRGGGGSFGGRFGPLYLGAGAGDWSGSVAIDYQGSQGGFSYTSDGGTAFDTSDDQVVQRSNNQVDSGSVMLKGSVNLGPGLTLGVTNFLHLKKLGVAGHGLHPTVSSSLESVRNLTALSLRGTKVAGTSFQFAVTPWVTWSQLRFEDPLGEVGIGVDDTRDRHVSTGLRANGSLPLALDAGLNWWLTPKVALELRHELFTAGGGGVSTDDVANSTRTRLSAGVGLECAIEPVDTEVIASLRHESSWSRLSTPENRDDLTREEPRNTSVDALTWRLALAQRSIPDVKLTANLSKSVRMPSLFELFGNTGGVLGNPSLLPEAGMNVDLGVVYRPSLSSSANVWSLELYAFWNQADDRIQFVRTSQGVSVAQNIASSEIYGAELGTYLDVWGHVRVRGSVTWMPALNRTPIPAYQGNQLPNRPVWKGYARLESYWPLEIEGEGEVGIHIDVEALAKNYDDLANLIEFPERVLVGAGLYATFLDRQWRLAIDGRNLGDASVQDFIGHPLPGLSVMASLAWSPSADDVSTGARP